MDLKICCVLLLGCFLVDEDQKNTIKCYWNKTLSSFVFVINGKQLMDHNGICIAFSTCTCLITAQ